MNLHRFRVFTCVAKHRSVSKASRELHLSQSALSQHLKVLQEQFGNLFKRNGRGLELTSRGEALYHEVRPILTQFDAAESKYSIATHAEKSKPVRVGASHGPGTLALPSLISSYMRLHPSVEIDLKVRNSSDMQDCVINGELDLAVITNPAPTASLEMEPFKTFRLCLFVSAHHPLARARHVSAEVLAKYPLVSGREQRVRSRTDELLGSMRTRGINLKVLMRCEWPDAVKAVVREGEAVGILYRDLIEQGVKAGRLRIINVAGVNLSIISYIVYSAEKPLSQNAKEFLDFVRAARRENSLDKTQLRGGVLSFGGQV